MVGGIRNWLNQRLEGVNLESVKRWPLRLIIPDDRAHCHGAACVGSLNVEFQSTRNACTVLNL